MEICTASNEKDLLHSRLATGLLWIAPWALIIISAIQINNYGGNLVHTLGWTVSFAVMGVACLVNARRCGRLHCSIRRRSFFWRRWPPCCMAWQFCRAAGMAGIGLQASQ